LIALVIPGYSRAVLNAPVYMDVLHGVEASLAEAGKTMVLRHLLPEALASAELLPQKVDGVVMFGSSRDEHLIRRLRGLSMIGKNRAADRGSVD
jgi:DNA-binding LacI/PurR family transcriptional regulator